MGARGGPSTTDIYPDSPQLSQLDAFDLPRSSCSVRLIYLSTARENGRCFSIRATCRWAFQLYIPSTGSTRGPDVDRVQHPAAATRQFDWFRVYSDRIWGAGRRFSSLRPIGWSRSWIRLSGFIIAIFAGAQLFTIGVIGEYLARMFYCTMHRPSYLVGRVTPDRTPER